MRSISQFFAALALLLALSCCPTVRTFQARSRTAAATARPLRTTLLLPPPPPHQRSTSSSPPKKASSSSALCLQPPPQSPLERSNKGTAVIAGASGYIGKAVVREAVRQGYRTIALVRDAAKFASDGRTKDDAEGSALRLLEPARGETIVVECDVTNATQVEATFQRLAAEHGGIDAVVSCLASRSGVKRDAYLIDYQATLNCLDAGRAVRAGHFVLLSAFCVKNPWLQFQQAKLRFEAALQAQSDVAYTVVRPTAFFKSVSGQLEVVQSGAPFVMFGDGEVTRCNPIAESDLATYLIDSVTDPTRRNRVINLGGPDDPITMKRQGHMLFSATGKEPKFAFAPLWLFDVIINSLQFFANVTGSEALEDAAETGRIGKYYAVEDMLTTDPAEKYGTITLQEHYNRIAVEGNDYDPYTTMLARARGVDVDGIQSEMKKTAAASRKAEQQAAAK